MTDMTPDLTGARVFAERGKTNSARWYLTPDGLVWHSRDGGQLDRSVHNAEDVQTSYWLTEVTE